MHRRGWLHRDVKPDNVMVTEDGAAKLLDLGLARSVTAPVEPEPFAAGTPGYMSPEASCCTGGRRARRGTARRRGSSRCAAALASEKAFERDVWMTSVEWR